MSDKCNQIFPDSEIHKLLYEFKSNWSEGFVEIGKEKIIMLQKYVEIAEEIEDFDVRNSDVIVASHPRTGTTWMQHMIWKISHPGQLTTNLNLKFPFLESSCLYDFKHVLESCNENLPWRNSVEFTKNIENCPRFIKTHLPWSVLPKDIKGGTKQPKIIYVIRNPKDTCVSYYHFCSVRGYQGNFENFCKLFIAGKLHFGPFFKNIMGYWKRRNESNILVIKFEDMKKDIKSVIHEVATFLNKELTDDNISYLMDHLSFEYMKQNQSSKRFGIYEPIKKNNSEFFRKGEVGTYKSEMSQEMIKTFDEWIEENTKGTDLSFKFD